jgi:hypothetical protein
MTGFLAELYLSRTDPEGAGGTAARARSAARRAARHGRALRYVRTTFVPDDELCFVLFEGDAAETVAEAGRRAGLEFERIVEAIEAP